MTAVRTGHPQEPHVKRLQFLVEGLQLRNPRPSLSELVSHQVTKTVALSADIRCGAGQELTDLLEGEAESLGTLDELKPANCLRPVLAVAGLGSPRRPQPTSGSR